jgi:hypothetical protein
MIFIDLLERAPIRHDSENHPGQECFGCKWESDARDMILDLQGHLSAAHLGQEKEKYSLMNFAYEDGAQIVLGHKSHWQESFDRVLRDEFCECIAAHIRSRKVSP